MELPETTEPPKVSTSTEYLRRKIREYTLKDRTDARAKTCDALRFGLGEIRTHIDEISLNENDVKGLAARAKRRKHATKEDMYRLSHAFLLSTENINAFSNTQGALQVVVKELTGSNFECQISALECICNLSLGELHVCEKICNMCGSYLVTYLDSPEKRLKQTSLWTLCNLLATGNKCAETLLKMELASKLSAIYVGVENSDYYEDAGICLHLLCLKTKHLLNEANYGVILEMLMKKNPTDPGSEYLLQIIFNCDVLSATNQVALKPPFIKWLVDCVLANLHGFSDINNKIHRLRVVYAIRVLANLLACCCLSFSILKTNLKEHWSITIADFFNFLFNYKTDKLLREIIWLLRNVFDAASQLNNDDSNEIENILANLNVPQTVLNVIQ